MLSGGCETQDNQNATTSNYTRVRLAQHPRPSEADRISSAWPSQRGIRTPSTPKSSSHVHQNQNATHIINHPSSHRPTRLSLAVRYLLPSHQYSASQAQPDNAQAIVNIARKAEKGELAIEETHAAEKLLEPWVVLNGIRSLFPLLGAVSAAAAVLF